MKAKTLILILFFLLFSFVNIMAGDFTDNSDGTVTDNNTELIWQQDEAGSMNWEGAISYCEGLSLAGHTDWRLPNIKELESITDDTLYSPAIDTNFFPENASYYWSSTTNPDYSYLACCVSFDNGIADGYGSNKTNSLYVRCVRAGQ